MKVKVSSLHFNADQKLINFANEKINKLENKIDSLAESQEELNKANSSDWLVDLLSVINDEADRKREMAQTVRIHRLEKAQRQRANTSMSMCLLDRKNC